MTKTLAAYWNFLVAAVSHREQTGSVVPSQRFLVAKMLAPIPENYSGQIIELGPGTGVLTSRLANRCPKARIVACEINPALARECRYHLATTGIGRRVKVVCDSAEHLLGEIAAKGVERPEFIISGIPLGNLDRARVIDLVQRVHTCLPPGGMYIQFQVHLDRPEEDSLPLPQTPHHPRLSKLSAGLRLLRPEVSSSARFRYPPLLQAFWPVMARLGPIFALEPTPQGWHPYNSPKVPTQAGQHPLIQL